MEPSSPTFVRVGDIIAGKYRIERILGQGGMGLVAAAMHVDLYERRAMKFMLPSCLGDAEFLERFMREARACARLKSRHVATVYDVGRLDNGAPYIVMEYLEGADLRTLLRDRKLIPIPEAVDYLLQACEALGEAHEAGIVHRDIKPANMFLTTGVGRAPCVKVLDFGIAKVAASGMGPEHHEMTTTEMVMGSPLYMAPEQMRSSRHVDARADIWSLGVVLFVMVTGALPFRAQNTLELCALIMVEPAPLPSSLNPLIPPELDSIILRCLEKDPARRWPNAADLADALQPFASPQTERARPSQTAPGSARESLASPRSAPTVVEKGPRPTPPPATPAPPSSTAPRSSAPSTASSPEPAPTSASGIYSQSASYAAASTLQSAELPPPPHSESTGSQTGGTWSQANGTPRPPARSHRSLALGAALGGTILSAGLTMFLMSRGSEPAKASGADAPATGQEGSVAMTPQPLPGKSAQVPDVAPAPTQSAIAPPLPEKSVQVADVAPAPTQSAAASISSSTSASSPPKEPLPKQLPPATPAPPPTAAKASPPAAPTKSKPDDSNNPFGRTRR